MVRNFDDYPDFQQKARGYKIMRHTVLRLFLLCAFNVERSQFSVFQLLYMIKKTEK